MARRRKSEPMALGELVPRLFGERATSITVSIVSAIWEAVLPPRVVKNASPTRLKDGVLFVETTTSAWAQEIQLLSPILLDKLRSGLPQMSIESLRAKAGPRHKRAAPERGRPPKVAPLAETELPADLRGELARITDDDVRAAVTKAARQSLAHRRGGSGR